MEQVGDKELDRSYLLHQQETQCHYHHTPDQTQEAVVALSVSPAGGQQFIQADVHHDSRDTDEEDTHNLRRNNAGTVSHEEPDSSIGNARAHGFSQSAQEGVFKGLFSISGDVIDMTPFGSRSFSKSMRS